MHLKKAATMPDQNSEPSVEPGRLVEVARPRNEVLRLQTQCDSKRAETDFEVSYRLLLPDGSTRYIYEYGVANNEAAGDYAHSGAMHNATDRTVAEHERIFGLFQTLGMEGSGTGVGIALAKKIVDLHGGRLWVDSEGERCGSRFCCSLPNPRSSAVSSA